MKMRQKKIAVFEDESEVPGQFGLSDRSDKSTIADTRMRER